MTAAETNCGSFHHPFPCFHGHCRRNRRRKFSGKMKKNKNSVRRSAPRGSQSSSFRDLCGDEKRDFSTFYFSQERDFRNSSTIPCRTESEIWTKMCSEDGKWSRDLVFQQFEDLLSLVRPQRNKSHRGDLSRNHKVPPVGLVFCVLIFKKK